MDACAAGLTATVWGPNLPLNEHNNTFVAVRKHRHAQPLTSASVKKTVERDAPSLSPVSSNTEHTIDDEDKDSLVDYQETECKPLPPASATAVALDIHFGDANVDSEEAGFDVDNDFFNDAQNVLLFKIVMYMQEIIHNVFKQLVMAKDAGMSSQRWNCSRRGSSRCSKFG